MKLIFSENAWDDYLYRQKTDKKLLKRINQLINDTYFDYQVDIDKFMRETDSTVKFRSLSSGDSSSCVM